MILLLGYVPIMPVTVDEQVSEADPQSLEQILLGLDPPPIPEGGAFDRKLVEGWLARTSRIEVFLHKEAARLNVEQARTVQALRRDPARMEADLQHQEVELLRGMLNDLQLEDAVKAYRVDATKALSKFVVDRESERERISSLNSFAISSGQSHLNETGQLGETRTISLLSTSISKELVDRFSHSYLPVWKRFRGSMLAHEARGSAAELTAKGAVPGPTTEAAARRLRMKRLELLLAAAAIHRQLAFQMLAF